MRYVSVAVAAERLGVGVSRVHQRIAAGSVAAERIGHQWVVDDASLPAVADLRRPGRPLSERSAWALVASSRGDRTALASLAPTERSRAGRRMRHLLLRASSDESSTEASAAETVSLLRARLRNRADRLLYRSSPLDLPDLRADGRVALSGVSHPRSGLAAGDVVEGYVPAEDVDGVVDAHLLSVSVRAEANVILHVTRTPLPRGLVEVALLLLAADLAEHRRPREEARALGCLREIAQQCPQLLADAQDGRR